MWWMICLLGIARLTLVRAIETSAADELRAVLHDAAVDEYRLYMDDMVQPLTPPRFEPTGTFMRSYLPGTGVGNREELLIKGIREVDVFNDADFNMWSYARFNNSDYILAANKEKVILKTVEFSTDDHFVFEADEAVLTHQADSSSKVIDISLFVRLNKRSTVLFAAILTESPWNSRLHLYEILGDTGAAATSIDLGISPSYQQLSTKKVSFVQSQYGASLVVLIDSPTVSKLVYQRKGSNELSHYIEVFYPNAVDLVTFTIHGHGYIAVANAKTCEVFKMDEFAREHLVFDRLVAFDQLVDLEYFRLGFNHYLAVASSSALQLYVWKSGEFSLKQTIPGQGIQGLYSVTLPTCRDDVLLFLFQNTVPELYVYSGKEDSFIKPEANIPANFRTLPRSMTSFTKKNAALLLFESAKEGRLVASVIETDLEHVPNPVVEAGEEVSMKMQVIQDMMKEQEKQINDIKNVLSNAVRRNGDQEINAYQTFNEIFSQETTIVNKVNDPIFVQWEGSSLTLQQYKEGTKRLEENIQDLERVIQELEAKILDVVRVDQDAVITGTKRFLGNVSGSSISAQSVNLEYVADIDMRQLQKDIYRLDKPQKIDGTLTFKQPLTILGDLDIEETLNGLDIGTDVMTTNTKQISSATMTFENKLKIEGDLQVSGKINDIKIKDEVVTLTGSHHITGKKIFLNGISAENVEVELLNGKILQEVYDGAFTKSGSQVIKGTKTFKGGLVTGDILLQGRLNGYNITELTNDIVRRDRVSTITGTKTFTDDVIITGDLKVGGTTNGLRIPDDLFLTDVEQTITGEKTFTGRVTANHVVVTGTVDGLNIPDDVVTLSGNEEVSSTLYFTDGISVRGDVIVSGLVDRVDVSELAKEALKANETHEFQDAVFMGNVTVVNDLLVAGKVNGVNLDDLVGDLVFKDDTNVVVKSEKRFKKVEADTIQLGGRINGYDLSRDFMTVKGDQHITGTKTFTGSLVLNNVEIADGMIGGLNITRLYENRISLIIDDEIDRKFDFSDEVIVRDLTVRGKIGDLRIPEDVVLKSSKLPIVNKVFTDTVKINNLVVEGDAVVSGSFGGVDLFEFYDERITLKGDQEIEGDIWLADSTIVNLKLDGLVNGVDIVELARNAMSKTKDQVITGEKEFLGDTVVYGPITTDKGVNGLDLSEINRRAFKLRGENNVFAEMEFSDLTVNDIKIHLINGINLTELAEDSLKKTGHQHVPGTTILQGDLIVEGDIDADDVNGLDIPRDLLLKTVPQTITGTYTLGSMVVSGNVEVEVDGLVNGMKLSEIAPKLVQNDKELIIESDVTFIGHIHVLNDLEVTGRVNGLDLKDLPNNVLLKKGDQVISGHKVIKGDVHIRGDMDVTNVNGMNWRNLLDDIVRTNEPQTIQGKRTFLNEVKADKVVAVEANANLINGKNLKEFLDDVVFTDVPTVITGVKTFNSTVIIRGDLNAELINGLNLKRDVITLMCSNDTDGVQVITGKKTFGNVSAAADIIVDGAINSYQLYDLYADTLYIEGDQTVKGHKSLVEEVEFHGSVNPGTVNGRILHEDLVTLDTEQDIHGPLIFTSDITLKDLEVDGLVNNIDLTKLAKDAVYLDTDDSINGLYTLETAVAHTDVAVEGDVNDLNLTSFDEKVSKFWSDANASVNLIERETDENCELVHNLQDILSKSYYALDGFEFYQEINSPATFIRTDYADEFTLVDFDLLSGSAKEASVVWSSAAKQFEPAEDSIDTKFKKVISRNVGHDDVVLRIGISSSDSIVIYNENPLDITHGFDEADVLVKGTDGFVIALLLKTKGVCEIYEYGTYPEKAVYYDSVSVGKGATSVSLFEVDGVVFLAVSTHYNTEPCKVLKRVNKNWQSLTGISTHSSTAVAHFSYHGYHYLVFSSISPVHETHVQKSLQVYRNTAAGGTGQKLGLFQTISFDNALGLEVFAFGDLDEIHLIAWNDTIVQVFRLEGESGFKESSTVRGKCIKDVKTLIIEDGIYMVVGQQSLENDLDVNSVIYKGMVKGTKYTPQTLEFCI